MDTMDSINIDEVRAVLASDPRLPAAEEIAVDAFGESVTLRGTVGSFAQQRAAVADARRVMGVADVVDELNVRLLNDDRREDAEIRGAALQRLIWDSLIPGDDLDVKVGDGWLTLKGEVGVPVPERPRVRRRRRPLRGDRRHERDQGRRGRLRRDAGVGRTAH